MWRIDWSKCRANDSQGPAETPAARSSRPVTSHSAARQVFTPRFSSAAQEPAAVSPSLQPYWQHGLKSTVRVCGPSVQVSWVLRPRFWVLWGPLLDEILHICHLFCGNSMDGWMDVISSSLSTHLCPSCSRNVAAVLWSFCDTDRRVHLSKFLLLQPRLGLCALNHTLFPYKSVNIKKP